MSRGRATAGSFLFLVLVPGAVAGLGPWLVTGWRARQLLRDALSWGD